jgi:O-antigen/teichoic acid export membrane protein
MNFFHHQLIKDFFVYSLGSLATKGSSLVLGPLFLRKLSPQELGLLALINSLSTILTLCMGCGLRQLFWIHFFHLDPIGKKQLLIDIIIIYLLLNIPLALLLYTGFTLFLSHWLHDIPSPLLGIIILCCFFNFFVELLYQVLIYTRKSLQVSLLQFGSATFTLTISCIGFVKGMGIYAFILAQCISTTAVLCYGIYKFIAYSLQNHINIERCKSSFVPLLSSSIMFLPSLVSSWTLTSSSRWIVAYSMDLHNVGLHSFIDMANSLFLALILTPLGNSYVPYILSKLAKNPERLYTIEQWNKTIMLFCMVIASIGVIFGCIFIIPRLSFIIPSAYQKLIPFLGISLLGNICLMGTYFSLCIVQFYKKTTFLISSLIGAACCNTTLTFLLLPRLGTGGASVALSLSYALYFITTIIYNLHITRQAINHNQTIPLS